MKPVLSIWWMQLWPYRHSWTVPPSTVLAAFLQPVKYTVVQHCSSHVQLVVHVLDVLQVFCLCISAALLSRQLTQFFFLLQYLESVRPLLDSEEYNQMEILANDFKDSKAAQLQRYLILKSWWATNYVSIVYKWYKILTKFQLNHNMR